LKILLSLYVALCTAACTESTAPDSTLAVTHQASIEQIVSSAKRIPTRSGWFEVLRLPNEVYAFWEPGHEEKVNSYLILGSDFDLLYDTGMGIANIREAIADVRDVEGLPQRPIKVVNSHNHLDHNGGNKAFDEVWTINDPWGIKRLTTGVPEGEAGGFVGYWDQLTPHKGVEPPAGFSPNTYLIPPYPLDQIRFLEEGQSIDLGNRRFHVIRTYSHSPDGIALYDQDSGMFFGGDAFYGAQYLITNIQLLVADLERIQELHIDWHYSSHGPQLVTAMQQGLHLATVNRMIAGEGETKTTSFAGFPLPLQELDGVSVTIAKDILLY